MPSEKSYEPLLSEEQDVGATISPCHTPHRYGSRLLPALLALCVFSCATNVYMIYRSTFQSSVQSTSKDVSLYTGLERDVPMQYMAESVFNPANRTLSDAAWDVWAVDPGIVALPHDWVKAKMLPRAQAWPWDGDKGVYILGAYHSLHCLQFLRGTILSLAEGRPLPAYHGSSEGTIEHNLHCIEVLRQDTLCNADDMPLYTGFSKHPAAGYLQTRMCRSWDKFEAWARDHTACYRDVGRDIEGYPEIEKYKFCPEGYIFSATGSPVPPWDTGSGFHVPGTF